MRLQLIRMGFGFVALALLAGAPLAVAMDAAEQLPPSAIDTMAQAASPQAIAEYRRKLKEYQDARAAFEEEAGAYWSSISERRKGGTGNHDMQSGLSSRPGSRAISTAIGYNQLLTTNSVELLAEQGHEFIKELTGRAASLSGAPRKTMDHKLAVLKKMVAFTRTVPDTWSEHEKLANTPQGWAVHALVLDIDVGPMLQTHKLLTSVIFARAKGYNRPLSAAELEMMNLTGDGTGLDMVTMPQAMREQVPTSNFFQRGGYERNPVAIRHNTVAKLLAVTDERMNFNSSKPGAKELAAAF